MIAIVGRPRAPEAPLSNAALETALDLLESGSEEGASDHYNRADRVEDSAFDRLRRLAAVRPASPLPNAPASTAASSTPVVEPQPDQNPVEGIARLRPRRPIVQVAPTPEEDGDDRLAGVIQGLSEALSQASVEKDERFGS
jgi:hypothetical protein